MPPGGGHCSGDFIFSILSNGGFSCQEIDKMFFRADKMERYFSLSSSIQKKKSLQAGYAKKAAAQKGEFLWKEKTIAF